MQPLLATNVTTLIKRRMCFIISCDCDFLREILARCNPFFIANNVPRDAVARVIDNVQVRNFERAGSLFESCNLHVFDSPSCVLHGCEIGAIRPHSTGVAGGLKDIPRHNAEELNNYKFQKLK